MPSARSHRRQPGRRTTVVVGCVVALTLTLTSGCTRSGDGKASSAGGAVQAAQAGPVKSAAGSSVAGSSSTAVTRVDVVTATMSLTTRRVDAAANRIATVASANGGRIDGDQRSAGGGPRTATVTVRVPPARLATVVAAVDRLGAETARTLTRTDVTTSKADVDARTSALATSVARLQHLLTTAGSVGSLLQVETALTSRQGELDALRARQRVLNDQIALAVLTVTLNSTTPVAATHHFHATGFLAAVGESIHGLGIAITVVVAAVGYVLPFAVAVLIVAGAVLLVRRRRRPARPPTPATPDAA